MKKDLIKLTHLLNDVMEMQQECKVDKICTSAEGEIDINVSNREHLLEMARMLDCGVININLTNSRKTIFSYNRVNFVYTEGSR